MSRSDLQTTPAPAPSTPVVTEPSRPVLAAPRGPATDVISRPVPVVNEEWRQWARGARPAEPAVTTRICIVIPAFNEGRSVAHVVAQVKAAIPGAHVVVVDDGSQDDTARRAREAGASVMTLPVNLGIGGAVQTGYRYAMRYGFDIAVQIDGDGQHDPFELERLLEPILCGRADMTVGSRWLGRGEYEASTGRRFGMRLLARLVCWRAKGRFTDTTSGFRAVGRRGIEMFARTYPTDFPEVESLVLASRHRLRIEEVPVRMTPRAHGRSSIAGLRSAYYMARVVIALVVDSLSRADAIGRVDGDETTDRKETK